VIVVGVSWLSYSSYLQIQNIQVVGATQEYPEIVTALIDSHLHQSSHTYISSNTIFTFDQAAIQNAILQAFPHVKSVTLARPSTFSKTLVVTLTERTPYGTWCADGSTCFFFDNSGYVYAALDASSSTTTAALPYIFLGGIASSSSPIGQSFVSAHLPGIVSFLTLLAQSGYHPTGARVENEQDFTVALTEGYAVKASFGEDPGQLIRNLQLILSTADGLQNQIAKLDYVDLRFGDRVYYKLKGGAAPVTASTTPAVH
jgi:cell division septal protein FtsQ